MYQNVAVETFKKRSEKVFLIKLYENVIMYYFLWCNLYI